MGKENFILFIFILALFFINATTQERNHDEVIKTIKEMKCITK